MGTDEPWLDREQQRAWVSMRAVSGLLDTALDRQLQRDHGISHATYVILSLLSELPGRRMPMTQLSVLANSSQSRLSHAMTRLEEQGWVRRQRSDSNKRIVYAELTDAGWDLVVQAAPGHAAKVQELVFSHLDRSQVYHLTAVNIAILRALADDGIPATQHVQDLTGQNRPVPESADESAEEGADDVCDEAG